MHVTLKQVSKLINGKLYGNPEETVKNISPIEKADIGDITFIANKKYLKFLETTNATAIILDKYYDNVNKNQIVVENPYLAYAKLLTFYLNFQKEYIGISKKASIGKNVNIITPVSIFDYVVIGDNSIIEKNVEIYPNVVIGKNVKIGNNSIIYPNVTIYDNTEIGNNVILHAGCVIGSDGYGFAQDGEEHYKIPHIGNVIIEDNVEIGANCTIDRGVMGSTIIKKGTKIDNLVHIAHNVEIGENSLIVAQVGISGSSKLGKNVILAGQVGVAGHLNIGNNVKVGAQSGIGKSLPDDSIVSGSPAIDHKEWLRWAVSYKKLPEIIKKVNSLEKEIEKLKESKND